MTMISPIAFTATLGTVASIATGSYDSCAIFSTGKIVCFGFNNNGNLGLGVTTRAGCGGTCIAMVDLPGIAFAIPTALATAITAGAYYTCALFTNSKIRW